MMQQAAAFLFTGKRQAADLADEMALALAGPAVTGEAAKLVGVLFGPMARPREFVDHELDGRGNRRFHRTVHQPARRKWRIGIGQQIDVPASERDQQAIEHLEAGVVDAFFIVGDGRGADADGLGELRLGEMAGDADTAKPGGAVCPHTICGDDTH